MKHILKTITTISLAAALLFTGCGINGNAVFATLDDQTIPLGLANFIAKYQQATYDSAYIAYLGEDYWTQDLYGTGSTMEDDVKGIISDMIRDFYLLDAHRDEYGVEITDAEMDDINAAAARFMESNQSKDLKAMGATEEYVAEYLRLFLVSDKMGAAVKDTVETPYTMEDAAQKAISYVTINYISYYDDDYNTIEYTPEEAADLKATAEKIASADNLEAAAEEAGVNCYTATFGDDNTTLSDTLKGSVDSLKVGETSGVLSDDTCYYVVRYDSEYDEQATADHLEELISDEKESKYVEILDSWREEASWEIDEEQWAKVKFDVLFKAPENPVTEE